MRLMAPEGMFGGFLPSHGLSPQKLRSAIFRLSLTKISFNPFSKVKKEPLGNRFRDSKGLLVFESSFLRRFLVFPPAAEIEFAELSKDHAKEG